MTVNSASSKPNNPNIETISSNDKDDSWQMTEDDCQCLADNNVILPMKHNQLKCYLPHRYPFMLVDRVTACRPNNCIVGYKNVTINEPFFQGHFPGEPIMPGVLIIEAMAQVSGILSFISEGLTYKDGYLFLFAGLDKVRFKKPVVPGDRLTLKSQMIMHRHDVYKFSTHAVVDEAIVACAQLTIVRQNRPMNLPL